VTLSTPLGNLPFGNALVILRLHYIQPGELGCESVLLHRATTIPNDLFVWGDFSDLEEVSMFTRSSSAIFSAACILFFATSAFAQDSLVCNPKEDPYECQCPSGESEYDSCYTTSASELVSPDDPAVLRNAAGITSSWNSQEGVWDVTIDATQLSAAGVIKLNSNNGQWDSLQQLWTYIGTLVGQEFTVQDYNEDGIADLPPMHITQTGRTLRFDVDQGIWAPENSGSLLFDAISDAQGAIHIGDASLDLFSYTTGTCPGIDGKSFDTDTDGTLLPVQADQCSNLDGGIIGPLQDCVKNGIYCNAIITTAKTTLDFSKDQLERTPFCIGGFDSSGFTGQCATGVQIVRRRADADILDLEMDYYNYGNHDSSDNPSATNKPSIVGSSTSTTKIHRGVCTTGTSKEGNYSTETQTREGAYDGGDPACIF